MRRLNGVRVEDLPTPDDNVLTEQQLNQLVRHMDLENKMFIKGVEYRMCAYSDPNEYGVVYARLRPVDRPF